MEQTKSILTPGESGENFKKMCVNCVFYNADDGTCHNQENESLAIEKLKQAISGYEISEIKLKPVPLKDDTKKCQRYDFNDSRILEYVKSVMQ